MSTTEFQTLLTTSMNQVQQFAYTFTKDQTDAEDLFQETLLKALRYQGNYTAGTNFKGWLYTIMKNIFINDYKRKKKRNTFVDPTEGQYYLESGSSVGSEIVERGLVHEDIQNALNGLEEIFSYPFEQYVKGMQYDEIAEELDIPIGTVKSRIFHARKRLRQELADYAN
ncbi:MAG: sigma-70 family RNA polymerase sigma factor [Flavobacteriales bacterium]|nr:sigma-70 family RNA polymerase sigma factor [Flavobacteriales bacterium]